MSAILDLSIYPVDKGESLSPYVARIERIIRESGLPNVFCPMSTSIEGELDDLLALVAKCHAELSTDCRRIEMNIRVDWRKDAVDRLHGKIRSVESKLK